MENNLVLDLRKGIAETEQYKAWIFPGGEIHFRFTDKFIQQLVDSPHRADLFIIARMNNATRFLFTCLIIDAIAKDFDSTIHLVIPYFPYQQADRDFAEGEPFALPTIIKLLSTTKVEQVLLFDPHSDVTPALLQQAFPSVTVMDNSSFIQEVIDNIAAENNAHITESDENDWTPSKNLTILSPDAGAYKKIFKLAEKIKFLGSIECANKYRKPITNEVFTRLSTTDFGMRDVLIVDDICMGGATFISLAEQIRTANCGRLYLAVSHGVFNKGFETLEQHFDKIFTTNSFRSQYDGAKKLKVIDILQ
jgi:ribose-phosphate pyrophosphokinase